MIQETAPFIHQRHFYVGAGTTRLIRYRDVSEEHYSSMPERERTVHISFESLVWFSLIALFWGFVIFGAIRWGI